MARVTVEDCIDKVSNRFDLVMLASHRARTISSGSPITIERDNDKNPVVALREIADETLTPDELYEETVESHQRHIEVDEPEEENNMAALMAGGGLGPDTRCRSGRATAGGSARVFDAPGGRGAAHPRWIDRVLHVPVGRSAQCLSAGLGCGGCRTRSPHSRALTESLHVEERI